VALFSTIKIPTGGLLLEYQKHARLLDEAQTVYLGNLARRANGVPPLRWNVQLTEAARWFSWDSVENRPEPFCGHQDTQGNWPDYRAHAFGYLGGAGAENAFCRYVTLSRGGRTAPTIAPTSSIPIRARSGWDIICATLMGAAM
jgi:hypothetical protein